MTQAYPLQWPEGWPRTPSHKQQDSKYRFKRSGPQGPSSAFWTFAEARDALYDELEALGASYVVLSSNFKLLASGIPTDGKGRPQDQGVAVYFDLHGKPMVMAQDTHVRAEENMRSLALAISAMRQLDRHGGGKMMERAFSGFEALPAPGDWRSALGFKPGYTPTKEDIATAFRTKARHAHPDMPGGSHEAMTALNDAVARAEQEIGAQS